MENYFNIRLMDKNELLKKFGKNVKIERIKRDLTQEQCAEIMGVSAHYFACIENGRQNMSLGKVLELSNILGFDLDKLLDFN